MTNPVTGYKAFKPDWTCNGFQYEIGQTYTIDGEITLCERGFHFCTIPFDCWNYYEGSLIFASVSAGSSKGDDGDDSKLVTAKITIEASISLPEWIKAQARVVVDLCKTAIGTFASEDGKCAAATGYRGHAAATGDWGHAAATGNWGHAAATGYSGHAAATGNSGHAAATGNSGHAAATGKHSIAASLGYAGTARGALGSWLVLAAWDENNNLLLVKSGRVGDDGIKPDTTYRLSGDGAFIEVAP